MTTLLIATGCASPAFDAENEHAARNRGAAGGVSGSMKDLQDSRESDRNQVLADGVSQDTRIDAEHRVAELEAEIKLIELEQKLADMETELEKSAPDSEES